MSRTIVQPRQLRVPGTGPEPDPQQQSRGARAVPPPVPRETAMLAEVLLELLDYVSKHSDDSAELNDATKWKLEEVLRRKS